MFEARCVDYHVHHALVDEVLPLDGTHCAPDMPMAPPPWLSRIPAPLAHEQILNAIDIASYMGLLLLDYYVTAYATVGATAQLLVEYDARMASAVFVGWAQPIQLNDAYYKYYFCNVGVVGLYVFGSDTLAHSGHWCAHAWQLLTRR